MIVRILSLGQSFKGLAAYLTHDPDAETQERVGWTHTRNLANDHVPSAVDEMLWTSRNAELLKQEAGVRAGGRSTENSVKHLSMNWAPDQNPSREHMIQTTEGFLRHMGWQEHQAIIVAHEDKAYKHVHVMLNVVHPETGLRLDDNFEWRRAQAWAKQYELEQGRVYCEQRLLSPEEREKSAPRNIWMAFQENEKKFGAAEKNLREQESISAGEPENRKDAERENLKETQRLERKRFFAEGKSEFSKLRSSIYREVREEFRELWSSYYLARKEGIDPDTLLVRKTEIVAQQTAILNERRAEACKALRESRDQRYRELLNEQRTVRADLKARQQEGADHTQFLGELQARNARPDMKAQFRDAAREAARPRRGSDGAAKEAGSDLRSKEEPRGRTANRNDGIGLKTGFSVGSFLDALFFDLVNLGSARPEPQELGPQEQDPFEAAAAETFKHQQTRDRENAEEERRRRQRAVYGE